jgi:hypothetical protein
MPNCLLFFLFSVIISPLSSVLTNCGNHVMNTSSMLYIQ